MVVAVNKSQAASDLGRHTGAPVAYSVHNMTLLACIHLRTRSDH